MCLPLTLIVYRHCIDFLFFCIIVFFFKNRFFKVRSLPASLTLHALKGSLPSLTLRFYPCSRRLPFYMITSLWQPTKKRAVLIEWGGFFHLFKKKNSRKNLKINNNYHYYAYENWKKKGNEGNDVNRKWLHSLQKWNGVTVLLWKSRSPTHFVRNFILEQEKKQKAKRKEQRKAHRKKYSMKLSEPVYN